MWKAEVDSSIEKQKWMETEFVSGNLLYIINYHY